MNDKSKPNGFFVFAVVVLAVLLLIRIVQVWYFSTLYLNVERILNRTESIEDAVVSDSSAEPQVAEPDTPAEPEPEPEPELTTVNPSEHEPDSTTDTSSMIASELEYLFDHLFALFPIMLSLSAVFHVSSLFLRLIEKG